LRKPERGTTFLERIDRSYAKLLAAARSGSLPIPPASAYVPSMSDEWFPLVDEQGNVIGRALRSQCHGNPALLHPVVHCLVLDAGGRLLLQLRSRFKDVQPGKWDTSVGGHVGVGEDIEAAVAREMGEELGLRAPPADLRFLYRYINCSPIETELVHTFTCTNAGPFRPAADEIEELRFWTTDEIRRAVGTGVLTPNFEHELARFTAIPR
jgi:isopentenyldiphosphate isomerase